MYDIFDNISYALDEMQVNWEIIFIEKPGMHYNSNLEKPNVIDVKHLKKYIESNSDKGTIFFTIDDYYIAKTLFKMNLNANLLIWAHYFMGHRFIFHKYNRTDHLFSISLPFRLSRILSELVPNLILRILLRKYVGALSKASVVSQSLWTDLLLERVHDIKTLGLLLIPVNPESFPINFTERTSRLLLFLGNFDETELTLLYDSIQVVKEVMPIDGIDFFGTEETGQLFQNNFHIKLEYVGKVSKEKLSAHYQSHFLTICPIYNGTFEMVPIESLLSGTPVISFIQPFMEVTGQSQMVANILNLSEIRRKTLLWNRLDNEIRINERNKILDVMDSRKVAQQFINYASDIMKRETA